MPQGTGYGQHSYPSGFKHLGMMGPSKSNEAYFLYPMAWRDVIFIFEDFHGDGLLESGASDFNEGNWVSGQNNASTAFVVPGTQLASGVAQGATGAYTADAISLYGDALFAGDNNAGCEFRYKIDDIDTQQMEVGFFDPLSDENESAVDDIDTPTVTNGAADIAVIARDTEQTFKSLAFITDGSTSNMNSTKTNLSTANHTNAIYAAARVQLDGNTSFAFLCDADSAITQSASHGEIIGSQIEGGTLVRARFLLETSANNAVTVDVDYVAVWQDRIA